MSRMATHRNGHTLRNGAPPHAVIGMVADEGTRQLLTQTAVQRGIPCAFEVGSIEDALDRLSPEETADCVLVELGDAMASVDDVAILASHLPVNTSFILLGTFKKGVREELAAAGASYCIERVFLREEIDAIFGVPVRAAQPALEPKPPSSAPAAVPLQSSPPRATSAPAIVPAGPRTHPPESASIQPQREELQIEVAYVDKPAEAAEPATHVPALGPAERPRAEPMRVFVPTRAEREAEAEETRANQDAADDLQRQPAARDWQNAPPSYNQPPAAPQKRNGRVIAVVGCRGGVGATSVAVSLAWLLSEENGIATALLDLDPHFGSVALALNLDPGEGLQQALERPSRVDSVFVERAVRKVGQHLFVLSSEQSLDKPLRADPTGPASLIRSLTQRYDRVIVDLPRSDPDSMTRVLAMADEIVLVTDLSLPGARDAVRLMAFVRKATSYARVRVIGGGARESGKGAALTPSEFRKAAGITFEANVAHDAEAANEAARSGRPIAKVAARGTLGRTLRGLVQSLEPSNQRERKRRLLFWKN